LRKREENLQAIIDNAKKASEKLSKVLQTKEEISKEKEAKLNAELKKDEIALLKNLELQENTRLKAKIHIQNVNKVVELQKEKKAKELETKKSEIAFKLNKAGQNRDHLLEKVVEKAQEIGQRRSASKDIAPKAEH
jgi:hypothetical protein